MLYNRLMALGATVVEPLKVWPDRCKVNGRMWGGSAVLELNGDKYDLGLWYHGSSSETVESLTPHFNLRGIISDKMDYDSGWCTVVTPCGILYHPTGWFRDRTLHARVGDHNNNFPERVSLAEVQRLLSVGLTWLVTW